MSNSRKVYVEIVREGEYPGISVTEIETFTLKELVIPKDHDFKRMFGIDSSNVIYMRYYTKSKGTDGKQKIEYLTGKIYNGTTMTLAEYCQDFAHKDPAIVVEWRNRGVENVCKTQGLRYIGMEKGDTTLREFRELQEDLTSIYKPLKNYIGETVTIEIINYEEPTGNNQICMLSGKLDSVSIPEGLIIDGQFYRFDSSKCTISGVYSEDGEKLYSNPNVAAEDNNNADDVKDGKKMRMQRHRQPVYATSSN